MFKIINWIISLKMPFLENTYIYNKDRTKSDTGGWVEYTKVIERMRLKELGKLTSVTSG